MSGSVRRDLTSEVKDLCDSTATDILSSANDVWDYYCSAVNDEVVAKVTESIPQTQPTGSVQSRTGSGESSPSETGSAGSSDPQNDDGDDSSDGGGVNKIAVIVGSVLGGIIGIAIIVGIAFFIRRRNKKAKSEQSHPTGPPEYTNAPELYGSTSREHLGKDVSGGEAIEMSPDERRQELQTHSQGDHLIPFHKPSEMDGTSDKQPRSPQRGADGVSPMSPEGMGWQSGPTEAYEMDATQPRRS